MQEITTYLPGILLAYAAFILTVASPGPNVMCLMGTSMSVGRKAGVSYALGVAIGTLTWGVLSVIGLSALLSTYALALYVIKVFGGLYLLWLAYKAFKSSRSEYDIETTELSKNVQNRFDYFKRAFIINMMNPKAALGWVAIISLGLKQNSPIWVSLAIVAGTFAISVIAHLLYAFAFSTPIMLRAYSRARRHIQATLAVFFTIAGIRLLTSKT